MTNTQVVSISIKDIVDAIYIVDPETKQERPIRWADFTVAHVQNIFDHMRTNPEAWANDFIYRLSLYTGYEYEDIEALQLNEGELETLLELCVFERLPAIDSLPPVKNFLQFYTDEERADWKVRVPKEEASLNRKTVDKQIPASIKRAIVGSKILFEQMVIPSFRETGDLIKSLHLAIAVYMQPLYYMHSLNDEEILQLAEVTKRCKFGDAYPIAAFFLKKWEISCRSNQRNFTTTPQKKKSMQGIMNSRSLVPTIISSQ
jgi:hypothetical protein